MSTPRPPRYSAEMIRELKEIDRQLRPVNDRILARLGLTRAEVIAEMDMVDSSTDFASVPTPHTATNATNRKAA